MGRWRWCCTIFEVAFLVEKIPVSFQNFKILDFRSRINLQARCWVNWQSFWTLKNIAWRKGECFLSLVKLTLPTIFQGKGYPGQILVPLNTITWTHFQYTTENTRIFGTFWSISRVSKPNFEISSALKKPKERRLKTRVTEERSVTFRHNYTCNKPPYFVVGQYSVHSTCILRN